MTTYAIGNALLDIMETVRDAPSSRLAEVYNHDNPAANGSYPYATIAPEPSNEDMHDTANNLATYSFMVRCVDVDDDKATMEQRMRQLHGDVMAELRKAANGTLSWIADKLAPFETEWGWEQQANTPCRFFQVRVTAQVLHSAQ